MTQYGLKEIKKQLLSGELAEGKINYGKGYAKVNERSLRTFASALKLKVSKDSDNKVFIITKKKEDENNTRSKRDN